MDDVDGGSDGGSGVGLSPVVGALFTVMLAGFGVVGLARGNLGPGLLVLGIAILGGLAGHVRWRTRQRRR